MSPLSRSMARPAGRPVALKARVGPSTSAATIWRLTVAPSALVWSPGFVIVGASLTGVTVIDTVAAAESASPSLAVKVKLSAPL